MRKIRTDDTQPGDITSRIEKHWIYNGLDCCVTLEVLDVLLKQLDPIRSGTYDFSRALQGPALEMRLRGVRIDQERRAKVIEELTALEDRLERNLETLVREGVRFPGFNWRAPKDRATLFYQYLRIPEIKHKGRVTCDQDALEHIYANYHIPKQCAMHILMLSELAAKLKILNMEVDPDGRIRTSYNIAGTSTGRFSSSFSEFGTGGNLQNIEKGLRSIFIADPGMKLAKFDAKSGESYVVGALEWNLGDGRYLDACETGDPHTYTAKLCWPNLPWTGNLKADKATAELPYYRHHTYRDMCKKLGHGSNYDGRPATLSAEAKVPISIVEQFQLQYFAAFPAHKVWHSDVAFQLRTKGYLTSLTERKCYFLGRRSDPKTIREAIAFSPQCSLADIVNRGMMNVWNAGYCIYMHDHDALTIQYPEEQEAEIIPKVFKLLEMPIRLSRDRTLLIPYDCQVGWNRGYASEENPRGLKDWK
jgi:DNA polymerase-1